MKMKIYDKYYNKLNPQQKKAVETIEGPVMVIAGPGTGKTQILAMRIANILQKTQVNPSNILALTFTNSASYEMRKRLLDIVGPASYACAIHTFHSFCNEIINTFPEKFVTARYLNQLTDLEQILIIQEILDAHNFTLLKPLKSPYYYQKAILNNINKLKQENIRPEEFEKDIKEIEDVKDKTKNEELAKIYKLYQNKLAENGQYDYADMILFVLDALRNDTDILSYYQEKYLYIHVDEYQDTNSAQNEIVRLLGSFYDSPNIFVVGDDEQSIFRFQGASLENILLFKKQYSDAKIIVLKDNYRSTQAILNVSRDLIKQNKNQIFNILKVDKKLKSQINLKGNINIGQFDNVRSENYFVASEIKNLIKKGVDPKDIAVFYKEHHDAIDLVELFSKLNVPYRLEVGGNILDDPEINKLINIFKVLNYQTPDDLLLFEIMHYPFFFLDEIDIFRLTRYASINRLKLIDVISGDIKKLNLDKPKNIKILFNTLLDCGHFSNNNTFTSTFEYIINKTGYLDYLLKLPDSVHHLNRLQILFSEIKKLNVHKKNLNIKTFLEYLDNLATNDLVIKDSEIEAKFSGVNLMTAHKAKGLEFEYVFIIKLIDKHWGNKTKRELIKLPNNILSIQNNITDLSVENAEDNIEEERRLFYVALTRAKKTIYLTYANNYGDEENSRLAIPSQFLEELPKKYLTAVDNTKIEHDISKSLELGFSENKWRPSKEMKEFIKDITEKFTISATSFNSYINCPYQFFLDHIIKVPKAKDFNQSYGTAVHKALENLFLIYKRDNKLPTKSMFIGFFTKALDEEILTDAEIKRAKHDGTDVLKKYYDYNVDEIKKKGPPISCEFNFKSHNVHFSDVPITGKIDKTEMIDSIGGTVRIVDYKTSAPKSLNELLGKTKKADMSYLYQAFFYKLLSESDPNFRYKITEIEFDFIADDNGKFKKIIVPIDKDDYELFKTTIKEVHAKILKMDFTKNTKNCKKYDRLCDYAPICDINKL